MQKLASHFIGLLIAVACAGGCTRPHAEDSSIVWLEQGLDVQGMKIFLGHRDPKMSPQGSLEPIVVITKDRNSVVDAMVFYRLVSASGSTTHGDEVATVFEPDSKGKMARYAQGPVQLPADNAAVAVRFRIILPGVDEEWTRDVALPNATASK